MNGINRLIGVLIILIITALIVVPYVSGVYTFADAIRGFEILYQFDNGAEFNTLNYPNFESPLYTYTVSWWAPGQWIVPFLISTSFGISNLQLLQIITITISLPLAILGFYKLFRTLNIDPFVRNLSLLSIICSPLFYWQSMMYYGGDLLILSYFPWFVLFLVSRPSRVRLVDGLIFFILGIVGVYIKTSMLVFLAGGGVFLFFKEQLTLTERIQQTWHFALASIAVFVVAKTVLISGETPASAYDHEGWYGIPNTMLGDLCYSFSSPFGSFTGLSTYLQQHSIVHGNSIGSGFILILTCCVSFIVMIRSAWKNPTYGKSMLFIGGFAFILFSIFYLQDRAVSYEMRHFAPIAFFFFPSIIRSIKDLFGKSFSFALIVLLAGINLNKYAENIGYLKSLPVKNGIKVSPSEAELADIIINWDNNQSNGLCLIEEYWAIAYNVKQNDKLVLKGQDLQVISGMELDHPDHLSAKFISDQSLANYNEILIIGQEANSTNLFNLVGNEHVIASGHVGSYEWKRIKP